MVLVVEALTVEAFADFGQVITVDNAERVFPINQGSTTRFHDIAPVEIVGDARAALSIFRGQARQFPFSLLLLERHPLGSQAFMPLNSGPYLVVVAPALDANQPDFHRVRCFLAQADQGVNYTKGTWHHPLIALKTPADFLVIDRVGVGHNCDEVWVPDHLSLRIERQSWEALLC